MKLVLTLPERPGMMHAVPILNVFALLVFFLLLGPSLVLQSGVAVDPVPSRFQMQRYEDSLVITLVAGEGVPKMFLGRDPMTFEELTGRLEKLRADGAKAKSIVLLQSEGSVTVGAEREVAEMVLDKGFRLAMVGKSAGQTPALPPSPAP